MVAHSWNFNTLSTGNFKKRFPGISLKGITVDFDFHIFHLSIDLNRSKFTGFAVYSAPVTFCFINEANLLLLAGYSLKEVPGRNADTAGLRL